jgi:hypothetical protein
MQSPLTALHAAMAVAGIRVQPSGTPQPQVDSDFSNMSIAAVVCGMHDRALLPRQLRRHGACVKVEILVTEQPPAVHARRWQQQQWAPARARQQHRSRSLVQ